MQGHFGAALIISGLTHRSAPLALLFVASQIQDFLIALLVYTLHIEVTRLTFDSSNKVFPFELLYVPFSHSLFSTICLAAIFYVIVPGTRLSKVSVAIAVLSHWLLDLVVHLPDLDVCFPFFDCGKAGLGLWRYLVPSLITESAIIVTGFVVYLRSTPSASLARHVGIRLFPLVLFMVFITVAMPFVPPPPKLDFSMTVQTYISYGLFAFLAHIAERPLVAAAGSAGDDKAQ